MGYGPEWHTPNPNDRPGVAPAVAFQRPHPEAPNATAQDSKPTEALIWEFPKIGGTLYFGVRIVMILLFRVLY